MLLLFTYQCVVTPFVVCFISLQFVFGILKWHFLITFRNNGFYVCLFYVRFFCEYIYKRYIEEISYEIDDLQMTFRLRLLTRYITREMRNIQIKHYIFWSPMVFLKQEWLCSCSFPNVCRAFQSSWDRPAQKSIVRLFCSN